MAICAVSWAAVSTKPQAEKESLADQHRLNHALADALDWEIVCDLTVPGETRSHARLDAARAAIQAYQDLYDLALSKSVSWLICKSRDRLARTRRLNREVADFLQDQGVRIYSRAIPPGNLQERSEAEVWGEAIESGFSEAEVLRLKQRREMGMRARVKQGRMASRLPWGFSYVLRDGQEKAELTDPRAEEAARFAIARFHQGLSKQSIVEEAWQKGLRSAWGKEWTINTVDQIVYQPAYYGLTAWGRRRYVNVDGRKVRKQVPPDKWLMAEANWDAPFTPAQWRLTLEEHKRRSEEHPRRRLTRFPLSGIAWCSECDLPMIGTSIHGEYLYYRCSRKWGPRRDKGRKRHSIPDHVLHEQIGEYLRDLATHPVMVRELIDRAEERSEQETQRTLGVLCEQEDELSERRRRWQDAYGSGVIGLEEFAGQLRSIEADEAALERRLEEAERDLQQIRRRQDLQEWIKQTAADLPVTLAGNLSDRDREVLRGIFRRLFKRVYVKAKRFTGKVELAI